MSMRDAAIAHDSSDPSNGEHEVDQMRVSDQEIILHSLLRYFRIQKQHRRLH